MLAGYQAAGKLNCWIVGSDGEIMAVSMRPTRPITIPILLWLSLGLMSMISAGEISVRSDSTFEFGSYSTYDLKAGTAARRDTLQQRIESALRRELKSIGLHESTETPDLIVVTHVLPDLHSLNQLSDEAYWEFITGVKSVDPYDIGAATLVVDLVDRETQKVVWRGVATGKVKQSVATIKKKIDKLVAKLIGELPPR